MKLKQFNTIWEKNNKMKNKIIDKVKVRGLDPTYEICKDYWMGKIRPFLNPYTGQTQHLNYRTQWKEIQRLRRDAYGKSKRVSRPYKHKKRRPR